MQTPRVLTCAEGNTEAFTNGKNVEVRRSYQAVACKKRYVVELEKPRCDPDVMITGRWVVVRWLYGIEVS